MLESLVLHETVPPEPDTIDLARRKVRYSNGQIGPPFARSTNPLVTIVIPTYNYAHFLIETLESALSQTYSNFEIIVVDDGSTDNTRERLQEYLGRIRYIYQENQGLSAARNTGIRSARGGLIALLDSDDLWHPRKLEIQVKYLLDHPEIGLLASDDLARTYSSSPAPSQIKDHPPDSWPTIADSSPGPARSLCIRDLVIRSHFGSCGVLVRKECFDLVGYFDTSLRSCEDRDMWIRIARHYPVVRLEIPLWWYRQHAGSMITVPVIMEEAELRVIRKSFDTFDVLHRRPFFRRKVLSRAFFASAVRYAESGMQLRALTRVAQSLLMWPLPYRREEVKSSFARIKSAVVIAMRLLGLRQR